MSDRIIVLKLQNRGMPGTGVSEIEKNQITSDIDALMNRPEVAGMGDLTDVDLDDLDDGMLLAWDEDDGVWRPTGNMPALDMQPGSDSLRFGPVTLIDARLGLTVQPHPTLSGVALLQPVYGTTANTIAEGPHTHVQPLPVRVTTAPSGYMSGGTRALGSTSVPLTNNVWHIVEAELYGQFRGADSGAAYYTLSVTIDGDTRTSPGGVGEFSCVQGVPDKIFWEHSRRISGTGASVPVSASVSFHSGSGFNVDRTYLKVRVRPDR